MRYELIKKRKEKKLTQKQIAEFLGVSTRMYQYIETNQRKGKIEYWYKLSELLDSTINELYRSN